MSAETSLRALLAADSPTAALVGTRIASDRMEQDVVRPFVVFARTSSQPVTTIDGTVLKTQVSLDVQCWADTRVGADAVADAVTTSVRGATSQTVPGRSALYDPDLDLHCTVLNVNWWE